MHVMIDLETMSNRANAAITQIGAVCFDLQSGPIPLKPVFNQHVELATSIAVGSHVDASTIMWWLDRDQDSRKALLSGQGMAVPLKQALDEFVTWLPRERIFPWSHGASFDIPIIEVAMSRFNMKPPWQFWDIRDTRTLFDIVNRKLTDLAPNTGVIHNASDDAVNQAHAVCAAYKMIKVG